MRCGAPWLRDWLGTGTSPIGMSHGGFVVPLYSLSTLRRALALLQGEGLIEKVQGRGNFVGAPSGGSRAWGEPGALMRIRLPTRLSMSPSAPPRPEHGATWLP